MATDRDLVGAYVDLVEQKIRIYVEDDRTHAVEDFAEADWIAGAVLELRQPGLFQKVHLGRVATIRVLPYDTPIEYVDNSWTSIKVRHWDDLKDE